MQLKEYWAKQFRNDWGIMNTLPALICLSIKRRFQFKVGNKKLGGTLALTYSNQQNREFQNNIYTLDKFKKPVTPVLPIIITGIAKMYWPAHWPTSLCN